MADADRDSDLGDDSPVVKRRIKRSVRSEGDSSGEQSCESSDEGVGRDVSATHQTHQTHSPHQPLQQHPQIQQHQLHTPLQPPHNMNHHATVNHQPINNHTINHQKNSPRPHERELKVRDDFESLKSSLHPHLSSLASLAQGAPLSAPNSVFALAGGAPTPGFPYTPSAFLAPAPPPPAQPAGSGSSTSSEGSAAGWSFEEQYKQVRQLYEISDEPQRKEFLDDLFSFMQKRGTPINRLPIMAKSVLDLYELYNLVIARGGLVEVINKKLWQEIIKGLRLPSSITSAAFTLRTQYMKYLYDYECEKKNLSTRSELDAAIEGNKREGRRASGQYDAQTAIINQFPFLMQPQLNRGGPVSLAQFQPHMQPLSVALTGGMTSIPRMLPIAPNTPQDLEYRFKEYLKVVQQQQEMIRNGSESPPGVSGPHGMVSREMSFNDVTKMTFWSLYNNNHLNGQPHDLEPQREALNLSDSPSSSNSGGKRERDSSCRPSPPPAKRHHTISSSERASTPPRPASGPPLLSPSPPREGAHMNVNAPANGRGIGAGFRIIARGDADGGEQLTVAIEINGMLYEGVLFAATANENNRRNNRDDGENHLAS